MESSHDRVWFHFDLYTRAVLGAIAILLGILAFRPSPQPAVVHAQAIANHLYIEPGVISLPSRNVNSAPQGKLVIDLNNGNVWGFPQITTLDQSAAVSEPLYLGRYDFAAMKKTP